MRSVDIDVLLLPRVERAGNEVSRTEQHLIAPGDVLVFRNVEVDIEPEAAGRKVPEVLYRCREPVTDRVARAGPEVAEQLERRWRQIPAAEHDRHRRHVALLVAFREVTDAIDDGADPDRTVRKPLFRVQPSELKSLRFTGRKRFGEVRDQPNVVRGDFVILGEG